MTLSDPHEEYELAPPTSSDLEEPDNSSDDHDEHVSHLLTGKSLPREDRHSTISLLRTIPYYYRRWLNPQRTRPRRSRSCACSRRSLLRKCVLLFYSFLLLIPLSILIEGLFFPSYTYSPPHYERLKQLVNNSKSPGRGNPNNQKVFLAASIADKDGYLAGGPWAENILQLIDLLGPENTFLSIYENDSGTDGEQALRKLEKKVPCKHSLVFDQHLSFDDLPRVTIPDGSKRVKRIAYLAEVRNRALKPLDTEKISYDRLLYLNDVYFNPIDVLQLLFSTNADKDGHANYRAACSVDFINPFKFYDTFATRDLGGYSMGVPFFPWFAYNGDKRSHNDVLANKDAVRVKSCWGGIAAFDMRFFQKQSTLKSIPPTAAADSPTNLLPPYRFRAEQDLFWDASECCLIHADIQSPDLEDTGIYLNPFVRVAYDTNTLSWLSFTRRFERLYTPVHYLIDVLAFMPAFNPRREETVWQEVKEAVWVPDSKNPQGGSFQIMSRLASHAGFCGRRKLEVMKPENYTDGGKYYEFIPVPPM